MQALQELRYLIEALMESKDFMKTVNTLVKYNEGLWKSVRQGKFVIASAEKFKSDKAQNWARKQPEYDPKTMIVAGLMSRIEGFGKRTQSKIRYQAMYAILDGHGVVAVARPKVDHRENEEGEFRFKIIPSSIKTVFTRDGGGPPENFFDFAGEARKQAQQREKQIIANQKTIEQIKSIPRWEDQDIFVDFIADLEAGRTLSPRQMDVIIRNAPAPKFDIGDVGEWREMLDRSYDYIERVVTAIKLSDEEHYERRLAKYRQGVAQAELEGRTYHEREPDMHDPKAYTDFLQNRDIKDERWVSWRMHSTLELINRYLRTRKLKRLDYYTVYEILGLVEKAIKKKGKRMTGKEAQAIQYVKLLDKSLDGMSVGQIKDIYEKDKERK